MNISHDWFEDVRVFSGKENPNGLSSDKPKDTPGTNLNGAPFNNPQEENKDD